MRQRKSPDDFRLRWRCAHEVKEALKPHGGPAAVGSPDTIPESHWYKAQAGDITSFLYRFCAGMLCLHNKGADTALERIFRFAETVYHELTEDVNDEDLERLTAREAREDAEADIATIDAAIAHFRDAPMLERMARERREAATVGLVVARRAEARVLRLRSDREHRRLYGRPAHGRTATDDRSDADRGERHCADLATRP